MQVLSVQHAAGLPGAKLSTRPVVCSVVEKVGMLQWGVHSRRRDEQARVQTPNFCHVHASKLQLDVVWRSVAALAQGYFALSVPGTHEQEELVEDHRHM